MRNPIGKYLKFIESESMKAINNGVRFEFIFEVIDNASILKGTYSAYDDISLRYSKIIGNYVMRAINDALKEDA